MSDWGGERPPRVAPRVSVRLKVELHNQGDPATARTVNLSRGGVLVRGDFPPLLEHPIKLTVKSPHDPDGVPLRAELRRLLPSPYPAEDDLALEFVDLSDFQRDSLERLVARAFEGRFGLPRELRGIEPGSTAARRILNEMPIKDRLAVALRGDRPERRHLASDPDTRIVEALTRNPKLDAHEARRLVARRDLGTAALRRLASQLRFVQDPDVRRGLLAHPRSDDTTLEAAIAHANTREIRDALRKPSISEVARKRLNDAL